MAKRSNSNRKVYIAISPSGNFYGSEQTLAAYLKLSKLPFIVFMPRNSRDEQIRAFQGCPNVEVRFFRSVWLLYLRVLTQLFNVIIQGGKASVYLNETGHFRYFRLLPASWRFKFIIHVRLLEDVYRRPWLAQDGDSLHVLSTSRFIQSALLKRGVKSQLLSSPYRGERLGIVQVQKNFSDFVVVSRLCDGKGLRYYREFCEYLASIQLSFTIRHFGESDAAGDNFVASLVEYNNVNWISMGYEVDKTLIYNKGTLLHLNPDEPLGVVLLEAVQYGVPFLAFSEGGTGEVARNLSLESFTRSVKDWSWAAGLMKIWEQFNSAEVENKLLNARLEMDNHYSPVRYAQRLDRVISEDKNPLV